MIPRKLELSGFLSYQQRCELDFTQFDLACISGPNGAGKSSLLDAITWALFGKARRNDESLINMASDVAVVTLEFEYEGNVYRVTRVKHRRRSTRLELQRLWQDRWQPLTERTLQQTQKRLNQLLRMDYDTFVHASFFLQGKADQFAQLTPARRKEVLAQILGLEVWETYRERARERRRVLEARRQAWQQEQEGLQRELAEEKQLRERLEQLQEQLQRQEEALALAQEQEEQLRLRLAELDALAQSAAGLHQAWQEAQARVAQLETRLRKVEEEIRVLTEKAARREQVYQDLTAWEQVRQTLQHWEALRQRFQELDQRRQLLQERLQAARQQLLTELRHLEAQEQEARSRETERQRLQQQRQRRFQQLEALTRQVQELDAELQAREELQVQLEQAQHQVQELRGQLQALRVRLQALDHAGEERCPVCAQPLPRDRADALRQHLQQEAHHLEQRLRAAGQRVQHLQRALQMLEHKRQRWHQLQIELERARTQGEQLEQRLEEIQGYLERWKQVHGARLQELRNQLAREAFAEETRQELARVEQELQALGYDARAHQQAREEEGRLARLHQELQEIERAQARLESLQAEKQRLYQELAQARPHARQLEASYRQLRQRLEERQTLQQQLTQWGERILRLREEVLQLQDGINHLRARLQVLQKHRERMRELDHHLEQSSVLLARYRMLEQAFGRDGVPALIIEQALPLLEEETNRLLERLTDGEMRIAFRTQRELRSREGQRQTLDILVSDRYGVREYETFSGGEAFRINFALRLALARFLARRAGARLQFLVIDEGFGSQDQTGRQRLVETIQTVRSEFAKILVITHLEDLKDRFPVRIEVEKGPEGSRLRVV